MLFLFFSAVLYDDNYRGLLSFIFLTNIAVNIQDEDSKLYKVYLVF